MRFPCLKQMSKAGWLIKSVKLQADAKSLPPLSAGGIGDNSVTVGNLAAEIMPTELKYVCYGLILCVFVRAWLLKCVCVWGGG